MHACMGAQACVHVCVFDSACVCVSVCEHTREQVCVHAYKCANEVYVHAAHRCKYNRGIMCDCKHASPSAHAQALGWLATAHAQQDGCHLPLKPHTMLLSHSQGLFSCAGLRYHACAQACTLP